MKQKACLHRFFAQLLALAMCVTMLPALTAVTATEAKANGNASVYLVNVTPAGGGKVMFDGQEESKKDVTQAEGTSVTVKTEPEEGYRLYAYRVGDPNASGVWAAEWTKVPEGTTSIEWKIPETTHVWIDSYYIHVLFVPVVSGEDYLIVPDQSNSVLAFKDFREKAKEGEEVSLSFERSSTAGWSYVSSVTITPDDPSIEPFEAERTMFTGFDAAFKFKMPKSAVRVSYKYATMRSLYDLVTEPAGLDAHVGGGNDRETGKKFVNGNQAAVISVDDYFDDQYYTHEIILSSDAENAKGLEVPTLTLTSNTEGKKTYTASANYPVTEGTMTVKFIKADPHTVSFAAFDGGEIAPVNGVTHTKGNIVQLRLTPEKDSGFYYDTSEESGITPLVKDNDGNEITVTKVRATATSGTFSFVMPEGDVTVSAPEGLVKSYPENTLTITDASVIKGVTPQNPRNGVPVKLETAVPEGKSLVYVKGEDDNGRAWYFYPDAEGNVSFTQPFDTNLKFTAMTDSFWFDEGNYDKAFYENLGATVNIYNGAQFAAFCKKCDDDKNYLTAYDVTVNLLSDIDLSAHQWRASYGGEAATEKWTLNGNGHTISGLKQDSMRLHYIMNENCYMKGGIFYAMQADVKDLTVKGNINAHIGVNNGYVLNYANGTSSTTFPVKAEIGILNAGNTTRNVGNTGVIDHVTADVDVCIDGMTDAAMQGVLYNGLGYTRGTGSAVRNSVMLGDVTVDAIKVAQNGNFTSRSGLLVAGFTMTSTSNLNISNNYSLSDIVVKDTVQAENAAISGLFHMSGTTSERQYVVNNYFGGTISAPENMKIGGVITLPISAIGANYSMGIDPAPESAYTFDNGTTVSGMERLSRQDNKNVLKTILNEWVIENQKQDENGKDIYSSWTSGEEGIPVFGSDNGGQVALQEYQITAEETENGGLVVPAKATAMEDVDIALYPDAGYEVDEVVVKKTNGRTVFAEKLEDNKYGFTMPASDVVVKVTYKSTTSLLTLRVDGQGTTTLKGRSYGFSDKAGRGETVDIRMLPDITGKYILQDVTVKSASGEVLPVTNENVKASIEDDYNTAMGDTSYNFRYSFVMPDEDAEVHVTYKDVSAWYNEDGSLIPGVYNMKFEFGKRSLPDGSVIAAMGYPSVMSNVTFTVRDDKTIRIDTYREAGVLSPAGYFGFGDTKISMKQPTEPTVESGMFNGGEGGTVNDTDYPVTMKMEDVTKWYAHPFNASGGNEAYTGEVYRTEIEGSVADGYVFTKKPMEKIKNGQDMSWYGDMVYPADFGFELPATVNLKNTKNVGERTIYIATYPAYMGYYTQMVSCAHFETLERVGDYNPDGPGEDPGETPDVIADGTYTVPVAMKNASLPEQNSMGHAALDGDATVEVKDGKASYTLTMKGVSVGEQLGHLMQMWQYAAEDTARENPIEVKIGETYTDKGLDGTEGTFPKTFIIERDTDKEEKFFVKLNVDAMNTNGYMPDALLVFDWDAASEAGEEPGEEPGEDPSDDAYTFEDVTLEKGEMAEDGEYAVNYNLWKYSENTASMGNDAIADAYDDLDGKQAKITVKEGKAYLTLDFSEMTLASLNKTGHLLEMIEMKNIVKDEDEGTIESFDRVEPVEVIYSEETDEFGPPEGKKYPKTLIFDITEHFNNYSNQATKIGYMAVQVFVPVMESISEGSGTQPARNRFEWGTLKMKKFAEAPAVEIDTDALQKAVDKALTDGAEYTEESWDAYQNALADAKKVLADAEATQEDVDNALKALKDAEKALEEKQDEPGQDEPGQEEPGQDEPGQEEPGQDEPGQEEPGQDEPGQDEPGQDEPGQDEPGQDEPGQDEPGQDEPGQEEPGQDEPGQDEPGQDEPGQDEPGQDEPGREEPGQDEPGQDEPGQDESGEGTLDPEDPVNEAPEKEDEGSNETVDVNGFLDFNFTTYMNVSLPFTDVVRGRWYYTPLQFMYANKLMIGTGSDTMEPDLRCNRATLVMILWNMEGKPAEDGINFFDVSKGSWYYDAMLWGKNHGLVNGVGGNRAVPEEVMTREQMAQFIKNYAEFKGVDITGRRSASTFRDANRISGWAKEAIEWALSEELLIGVGNNTLLPEGDSTRAQIATVMQRFLEAYAKPKAIN